MPSANTDTPSSVPNVYYFIRHEMNWDDAHAYCIREHTAMAQIYSKQNVKEMMNTAPEGYTDKAWIGQYENISEWTWADGQPATYFNWRPGVFLDPVESCVMLDNDGHWNSVNCSTKRRFVCYDGKFTVLSLWYVKFLFWETFECSAFQRELYFLLH